MIAKFIFMINNHLSIKLKGILVITIFVAFSILLVLYPFIHFKYIGYFGILTIIITTMLSGFYSDSILVTKKYLLLPIIAITITYLIFAFVYSDSNRVVMAGYFGVLAPLSSYFLANKESRNFFINNFTKANVIILILLIIVSAIFAPLLDEQYSSIMLNPNGFSTVLTPISYSLLYLFEVYKRNQMKIRALLIMLLFGFNCAFMVFSRSRTGMVSLIAIVLLWVIYLICNRINIKRLLCNLILMIIVVSVTLPLATTLLTDVNYSIMNKEAKLTGRYFVFALERYGVCKSNGESSSHVDTKQAINGMVMRTEQGSKKGEDVSSGRFSIWKSTVKSLNFRGHDKNDVFYVPHRMDYTNDTHNMYLSMGFFNGYVGLISITIFMAIYLVYLFKLFINSILRRQMKLEYFFTLAVAGTFFIISMLSTTFTPTGSYIALAFWTTIPIFERGKMKNNDIC